MPGTIGNTSNLSGYGPVTVNTSDPQRLMNGSGNVYTAVAGDQITKIGHGGGNLATGQLEIGVYDTTTNALVGSTTITQSVGISTWYEVSVGPWALTAGRNYAMAWRAISNTSFSLLATASSGQSHATLTGTTALQPSFTTGATFNSRFPVRATVEAAAPIITTTSDDTPTDGTTLTITGTGFGTQTGSAQVTVSGVVVTPSRWTSTEIDIPITIGANKYNVNAPIVVRDSSGTSSSAYNVQIQPASGVNYVNIAAPLAAAEDRITSTPDIADGDQVEWSNVVGGSIGDVTVNSDGSFVVAEAVTAFDVRVNDGTGWGDYATQSMTPAGSRYTYNVRKSKRVFIA